jgi:hypothetical protein
VTRIGHVAVAAVLLLTACTTSQVTVIRTTTTQTVTHPPPSVAVTVDQFVRPLPPGDATPSGEIDRRCPYIRTGLNEDANGYDEHAANVADIEGDRIYRTTVLSRLRPIGCRFYFYAPPYEAVADIVPRTYPTALDAHNALVAIARLGTDAMSQPAFVPGVDGILYRTRFFIDDDRRDWAFAFAKGRVLVVVHTQRTDTSLSAMLLGKAVVGRF